MAAAGNFGGQADRLIDHDLSPNRLGHPPMPAITTGYGQGKDFAPTTENSKYMLL
jgi:hypothetical protein